MSHNWCGLEKKFKRDVHNKCEFYKQLYVFSTHMMGRVSKVPQVYFFLTEASQQSDA